MVKLKIDIHERKKIPFIDNYLQATTIDHLTKSYTVERLDAGDYITDDCVIGVERKADDFLPSLFGGGLRQQLKELHDNFECPYLFVEFKSIQHVIEHYNVNPEIITGAVASILSRSHVPIIFVGAYFAPVLFKLIDKAYDGKSLKYSKEYSPIRRKPTHKESSFHVVQSAFRGLGVSDVLAQRLLDQFGSALSVFNATEKELTKVEGIGKKKAHTLYNILRYKENNYEIR